MKSLVSVSLKRPVTIMAFYLLVVALGVVAYVRLPVALLPDLQYPVLVVWTPYPDVAPERVERAVTRPVEDAVAGIPGLLDVTSRSQVGGSLVRLRFGWNHDLDLAFLEAREALDRQTGAFPEEAERPVILQVDPSDRPILAIALQPAGDPDPSPQALRRLKDVGREVISRRIEQLPGVARVRVSGGYERELSVRIDPDGPAQYGISVQDVKSALDNTNVALPGGVIRRGALQYAVTVSGEFEGVADIERVLIPRNNGPPIRLAEIASVVDGVAERRGLVRLNGRETLLLLVDRTPEANTVRTAAEVRRVLGEIQEEFPELSLEVVIDESRFVRESIAGIAQSLLWGGLLAVLVLLFFLRRPRALLAVGLAVPLSLIMTLVAFDLVGVSINLISLSGLALGIGLLVDNSIVVVENAARLRADGAAPFAAARDGARQVAGAILASTLTTISVFIPITFIEGAAGRLFRDQSFAVVISLACSLFVALTVIPLVISRDDRSFATTTPRRRFLELYEDVLQWALDRRGLVLGVSAALILIGGVVLGVLPREVVPGTDQGRLEAEISLAPGSDLPSLERSVSAIEANLLGEDGIDQVLSDLGERDQTQLELDPRPPYEGALTIMTAGKAVDVIPAVREAAAGLAVELDVRSAQTQLGALLESGDADLFIDLVSERREEATRAVPRLLEELRSSDALENVRLLDDAAVPAYIVELDRDNMARYGADAQSVAAAFQAATRGTWATELHAVGDDTPVTVFAGYENGSLDRVLDAQVGTRVGALPLRRFVRVEKTVLPAALVRVGRAPVVRLAADVARGSDLAAAEKAAARAAPAGIRTAVRGVNEEFRQGVRAIGWSLLVSVLLVFLILAAQFESLRLPLAVIAAVPLALFGVALVLALTGQTVNLMSMTGCIVLVGIVVNDAIIKVDLANQYRAEGFGVREAIVRAGHDRFRPVWMTTITTVLGLFPLAVGIGAGAELRAPLGIVVVGGLLAATTLTLVVTPVLYTFLVSEQNEPDASP